MFLAGILSAIWELFREPLLELSAARRYNRIASDYAGMGIKGTWERLKPYKLNLFLILLFTFFFLLFSFIGSVPLIPVILGLTGFSFIIYLFFRFESDNSHKNRHKPFVPVLLYPIRTKTFLLFPFILPFALMSCTAFLVPQVFSQPLENSNLVQPKYLISPEEHALHIEFSRSFPYMVLNQDLNGYSPYEEYLRYYLGEDGLIAGSFSDEQSLHAQDLQATFFPLEKLMTFLLNYNEGDIDSPFRR